MSRQSHFQVFSQENENLCTHKHMHVNVFSSFIHIAKNGTQPKCPSTGECVNKHMPIKWNTTWQ